MKNLNEEILRQQLLMNFDGSKPLLEQKVPKDVPSDRLGPKGDFQPSRTAPKFNPNKKVDVGQSFDAKKLLQNAAQNKHITGLEKPNEFVYNDPVTSRKYTFDSYDDYKKAMKNLKFGKEVEGNIFDTFLSDFKSYDIDDLIAFLSSVIQLIPGLGTLVGTIIEALHGISYIIRAYYETDEKKKWKNIILGIIQSILVLIPTPGGNVLFMAVKGKLNKVILMTPVNILKMLGYKIVLGKVKIPSWGACLWLFIQKMGINISSDKISSALVEYKKLYSRICPSLMSALIPSTVCDGLLFLFDQPTNKIKETIKDIKKIESEIDDFEKGQKQEKINKEQNQEKINTTNDNSYDYKLSNGKYYYRKKSQIKWIEAKGVSLDSIKQKVRFNK